MRTIVSKTLNPQIATVSEYMIKTALVLFLGIIMIGLTYSMSSSEAIEIDNKEGKPFLTGKTLAKQKTIAMMSGNVMFNLAEQHGLGSIMGKQIGFNGNPGGSESTLPVTDVIVADDSDWHENEPSIASNPIDPSKMVVVSHRFDGGSDDPCAAWYSTDGGTTWSDHVPLPLSPSGEYCSDPVVRYSPDGSTVYALYMSINPATADIVVTRSTNNGKTWETPPVVAIEGKDYDGDGVKDFPDKPWLDVHKFAKFDQAKKSVYVTTTIFDNDGDCGIFFTSSSDKGLTFATPQELVSSTDCNPVVQGSRPGGGNDDPTSGTVLVCWYHSGSDGWLAGEFEIRCRSSNDYGVQNSFGSESTAFSSNGLFEVSYWLCPNSSFHRSWGSMFPAMTIDKNGLAHLVVTADPTSGDGDGECGDIYYFSSKDSNYNNWNDFTKLSNDDKQRAQLYATITTHSDGETLLAAWEDHRNSKPCRFLFVGNVKQNCTYDIYYTQGITLTSSSNERLTDASSLSDYQFIGDYMDGTEGQSVHLVWTDRRDKTSIFDPEDNVLSDKVASPDPDTTPPVISNIVKTPSSTSATITWTTDELATSRVDYGLADTYGSFVSDPTLVTSHSIQLTGLSSPIEYHFKVTSVDSSGNIASSGDLTFNTTAPDDDEPNPCSRGKAKQGKC